MSTRTASYAALRYSSSTNRRPSGGGGSGGAVPRRSLARPSSGAPQFTLHGTRRSTPGVGRTFASPTHTPMRGAEPRAHGMRGVSTPAQATKVLGGGRPTTSGEAAAASLTARAAEVAAHLPLHHGAYPRRWVQKLARYETAGDYTEAVAAGACRTAPADFSCEAAPYDAGRASCCPPDDAPSEYDLARAELRRAPTILRRPPKAPRRDRTGRLTKNVREAMDQGKYVRTRYLRLREVGVHAPAALGPYPTEGGGAARGCGGSAYTRTWQEAQAAGQLPADWRVR